MGYGGPRVGFQTSTQHANHTATIRREDAARVADIVHRRSSTSDAEQLRQREVAFREYEAAQAAEAARVRTEAAAALAARKAQDERQQQRRHGAPSPAEMTARRARAARLTKLAQPRDRSDASLSGTACGCVVHPRGSTVTYPTGRNGAPYTPGVDRDRVMPARPALGSGTTPPWVGSYSTHHGPRGDDALAAAAAREEAAYACGNPSPPRSAQEEGRRQKVLRELAATMNADAQQPADTAGFAAAPAAPSQHAAAASFVGENEGEEDTASVFSHGSSNGPIVATGNAHMCTASTKESVQLHLSRYGGAMTAPRQPRTGQRVAVETLTLPELSHRLVKMQAPSSQR